MLGVGAGAPAPPLVRAPLVAGAVVTPHLPPLFSSSLRRHPCAIAAAAKQKQGRRRWWSDADAELEEEEEEEEEDFFTGSSSFGGELFDEPWFSKVFKTYGFLLPVMLASMLVATGPRAFLMAMAIPIAQSAVSFLLDVIWERNGSRRRRPFQEEEEGEEEEGEGFPQYSSDRSSSNSYYGGRRRPQSYQSWVSDDFAAASADCSTKKNSGGAKSGSFGGWDELLDKDDDAGGQFASDSKKDGAGQATARTRRTVDDDAAQVPGSPLPLSRRRFRRGGRMSASNKYKQAPLLMRLMVAVFPFLGSWFRLL